MVVLLLKLPNSVDESLSIIFIVTFLTVMSGILFDTLIVVVVLHPLRMSNLFVNFFYSVVYFLFLVNVWYFCSLDEIGNLLGHSSSPADACSFCLPWNAETRQEQHVFQKKNIHLNKILTKEESFHLAPKAQAFQNTTHLHPSPPKNILLDLLLLTYWYKTLASLRSSSLYLYNFTIYTESS